MTGRPVGLVLDASSVLAWCFEDEGGPEADALIDRVAASGAIVPAIWPLEVANALVVAQRRGRITGDDSASYLGMLGELPVIVDGATASHAFHETIALARDLGLSAYDAAYLELAARTGLPIATADGALRRAAERAGLTAIA